MRLAVGGERNSEGGEMGRAGSAGGGIQRDLGRLAGRIGKHIGGLVAEREPGQPAGEGEVAPLVVKLVADHAVVVARFRQDVAEFRRKPRARESIEQGVGVFQHLRLHAACRDVRLALELEPADAARRDKSGRRDQCA